MDLAQHVEVPPAVNQMETHVFNQQADNRAWYTKYGTALESWGPLAQGRNNIFTHPVLTAVGEKHGKTAAQVGHAVMLAAGAMTVEDVRAWQDAHWAVSVRDADAATWSGLVAECERGTAVGVRDAGYTEVAPGSMTVIAELDVPRTA